MAIILLSLFALPSLAKDGASEGTSTNSLPQPAAETPVQQNWNVHAQNTIIVQGYPGFPSQYSGPNSLPSGGQTRETISLDLMAGVRLWRGAEAHVDGMMWQGFGIGNTVGIEGFPNGEAFKAGTSVPNVNFARILVRQTFGFGGPQEDVPDDAQDLAGKVDVYRLTITAGRLSAKDIFDNNAYANDPRTQFMNWGLMANQAWDYPGDALGFISGITFELNQPQWTERYGFFQMPATANGLATDLHLLKAWGMVWELERRYSLANHPGVIRFLGYLNRANMGSYQDAVNIFNMNPAIPANIVPTRTYRLKYGFGLNWEQEVYQNIGVFSRLGWNNGQAEGWTFSDVNYALSLGLSIKGAGWHRPGDTVGLGGVFNGASHIQQQFLQDGGTGILNGDGALSYGWERILETYYSAQIWKTISGTVDYQFVSNPAFNRARGPVSVFAARLHWEF